MGVSILQFKVVQHEVVSDVVHEEAHDFIVEPDEVSVLQKKSVTAQAVLAPVPLPLLHEIMGVSTLQLEPLLQQLTPVPAVHVAAQLLLTAELATSVLQNISDMRQLVFVPAPAPLLHESMGVSTLQLAPLVQHVTVVEAMHEDAHDFTTEPVDVSVLHVVSATPHAALAPLPVPVLHDTMGTALLQLSVVQQNVVDASAVHVAAHDFVTVPPLITVLQKSELVHAVSTVPAPEPL